MTSAPNATPTIPATRLPSLKLVETRSPAALVAEAELDGADEAVGVVTTTEEERVAVVELLMTTVAVPVVTNVVGLKVDDLCE